uniref:Uncharacterized protein n=1 Tax=Oncorhynchus mykiss TaxID=8022 RepID=A0A8K9XFB8_ONCMY
MHLNREEGNSKGSLSISVFLVSLGLTVCSVWLVALCGVCTWCQRKLVSGPLTFTYNIISYYLVLGHTGLPRTTQYSRLPSTLP